MRIALLIGVMLVLPACTLFPDSSEDESRSVYVLAPQIESPAATLACGSIQVSPGAGASGFRSSRMAYMREPFKLEFFAYSVWADNPARMLSEVVREYFYASGAFEAVVSTPAVTATDLRLDLGDGKVLQRFEGDDSTLEMSIEARLYASARPRQILSKRFHIIETAAPDPAGGVVAANAAAGQLLEAIFEFAQQGCREVQRDD